MIIGLRAGELFTPSLCLCASVVEQSSAVSCDDVAVHRRFENHRDTEAQRSRNYSALSRHEPFDPILGYGGIEVQE